MRGELGGAWEGERRFNSAAPNVCCLSCVSTCLIVLCFFSQASRVAIISSVLLLLTSILLFYAAIWLCWTDMGLRRESDDRDCSASRAQVPCARRHSGCGPGKVSLEPLSLLLNQSFPICGAPANSVMMEAPAVTLSGMTLSFYRARSAPAFVYASLLVRSRGYALPATATAVRMISLVSLEIGLKHSLSVVLCRGWGCDLFKDVALGGGGGLGDAQEHLCKEIEMVLLCLMLSQLLISSQGGCLFYPRHWRSCGGGGEGGKCWFASG